MQATNILTCEEEIMYSCLNPQNLKSFFLFAGAGSGKTRSLVTILKKFKQEYSQELRFDNQKIAVITYTNAACDEIRERLDFDDTFVISTIHSFSWDLIKTFQSDIKKWVIENLKINIAELEETLAQVKNKTTKKYTSNQEKLQNKRDRLMKINDIKTFSYEPNGINAGRDSLNHAEVIQITSDFLANKPLLQSILIKKHPILLIDESQDTNKNLLNSFFTVQNMHKNIFCLGLFGDTMQRIYFDGLENLGKNIPNVWEVPKKIYNYRSCRRIIELANIVRSDVDDIKQEPVKEVEGFVRLFIIDTNKNVNKELIETKASEQMYELSNDSMWLSRSEIKTLTLEHHMAASRGGFLDFFESLYNVEKYKMGLLDGSLNGVNYLLNIILPLVNAKRDNNKLKIAQIVKQYSPLLSKENLKRVISPRDELKAANDAIYQLFALWDNNSPKLYEIIKLLEEQTLFELPEIFSQVLNTKNISDDISDEIRSWMNALDCDFCEFEAYANYIFDKSTFGTHQGIKGLEFDRVMAIIDDEESRGFMFKYDKLFGLNELSQTDIKNAQEGKETSIDRARRLFYVICTRAKQSLAIVAYTKSPDLLKTKILNKKWFKENEIIML